MRETFIHLSETFSTNSYLREVAAKEKDQPEGTVVVADYQTSGRGQRGNSWESERGENLLFSLLLHPSHIPAGRQFVLSQIVSLAIVDVLLEYDPDFSVKWPNDIYWREKKITGILIEVDLTGTMLSDAIVGIGLNVNQKVFRSPAPNPVSLAQITGTDHSLPELLDKLLDRLADEYSGYSPENDESIQERYMNRLFRKEGVHPYRYGDEVFGASIAGIGENGQLILKDESGILRSFMFKEISFVI